MSRARRPACDACGIGRSELLRRFGTYLRKRFGLPDLVNRLEDSRQNFFRMQRDALRGRLEILRGDYDRAYKRLKKTLRLASPRRVRVPWRNLILQLQLNTERAAVTEAYSLLAIAAHETGNEDTLAWALDESRSRGVDVSLLEPVD